jgi:hypothetical protein
MWPVREIPVVQMPLDPQDSINCDENPVKHPDSELRERMKRQNHETNEALLRGVRVLETQD